VLVVDQHLPLKVGLTIGGSDVARHYAPSRPQQFHYVPLLMAVRAVHGRPARVDMYVRVRATIKQQSRHLMPSQSRGMPQRISLRIRDPVSFTGRDALVRVEPRLEQKLEHLDTIVPNCDREQATLIPTNVIRELAFGQTRAQPLQVVVRNSLAFAREGADVLISYLDEHEDAQETARLVKDAGRKAILAGGDIQDYGHCEQLVERSFDELGGLDILINNAAFQMTHESIEELTPEEWDKTFKTNI